MFSLLENRKKNIGIERYGSKSLVNALKGIPYQKGLKRLKFQSRIHKKALLVSWSCDVEIRNLKHEVKGIKYGIGYSLDTEGNNQDTSHWNGEK